jgi:hypothetical protein
MGAYVRVCCGMRECKHNEDGWCASNSITLFQIGDYEMKCQENTTRY